MEDRQIREDLRQILREFLAEYSAASEESYRKHLARNGDGYLLPSKGRFFTAEEREAFAASSAQYRDRAERILFAASREALANTPQRSRKINHLDSLREAFSLMDVTEAEAGRWSGNFPAYVDQLLETAFPVFPF